MAEEFEQRARQALARGQVTEIIGADPNAVVARLPEVDDGWTILYDTLDGHAARVRKSDVNKLLATQRPLVKGQRPQWYKHPNGGVYQSAPGGVTPAYSETPVQSAAFKVGVAPDSEGKADRQSKRRRGARGARRRKANALHRSS